MEADIKSGVTALWVIVGLLSAITVLLVMIRSHIAIIQVKIAPETPVDETYVERAM